MPTDGLTGWSEGARRVGEGFSAILAGTARVMHDRAQVAAAGELADFSERLKTIEQETRDELANQDVQDWNYAWHTTSAPKVAEAINELSPSSRRAGQQLAAAYTARAAVEAQRDYELGKIDKARTQWKTQLDNAVQAGDARQAHEWLQVGQGIFVPEENLPAESEAIESQARLSHWKKELQDAPLRTLSALAGAQESELPQQKTDAQMLAHAQSLARRTARRQALGNLVSCMESGVTPEREYVEMAVKAGALTEKQAESAMKETSSALTPVMKCDWTRRVDECADGDEAAENLMLDIATADMPVHDKRYLLNRIETSRKLPAADRQLLSRKLWDMYHDGIFGCPGDELAQSHFAEIQQSCLARLQNDGKDGMAHWLSSLRHSTDKWVCFSDNTLI